MVPSLIAKQARLAAIVYRRGFEVDALLLDIHRRLRAAGRRLGGIIQASYGDRDDCASSVRVVDLASGQDYDIWQDRGACARGCRLDERGLLEAEPVVLRAIDARVDIIILNRFGRAESRGSGLIACFAAALDAGVPVLTTVREPYVNAWTAFHGGLGVELPPDPAVARAWCRAQAGMPRDSQHDCSSGEWRQGT